MATKDGKRKRPSNISITRVISRTLFGIVLIAVIGFSAFAYWQYNNPGLEDFPDTEIGNKEFFKYGSIGNNLTEGLPHKIWAVMPNICHRIIGKNKTYKEFGFIYDKNKDPKKDLPIGFSKARFLGSDLVAINCAVCHVQNYRTSPNSKTKTFIGGTATGLDAQRYLRFISACGSSDQFTAKNIAKAVEKKFPDTPWYELISYRLMVPYVRNEINRLITKRYAWTWSRPAWGPGRVDPFNPVKFHYLEQPIDNTVGNSDIMPAWNAKLKEEIQEKLRPGEKIKMWHWDGLSRDLWEVILNSALGDGTVARYYDKALIDRLQKHLYTIKSPPSPLKKNEDLLVRGKNLFKQYCNDCHGRDGQKVMSLIPISEIGTDDNRLKMWTEEATKAYNLYDKDGSYNGRKKGRDRSGVKMRWTFKHFYNDEAYLSQPLNGIWLSGPYLHNGSVPTLFDLLKPVEERPKNYVRGSNILDLKKGGYISNPCEPSTYQGEGFCYDTSLRGNSNKGHEYGVNELNDDDRLALVHYLLSL